jgi:antitoxin component YwqK of YwqJK toxin-antitoxin module
MQAMASRKRCREDDPIQNIIVSAVETLSISKKKARAAEESVTEDGPFGHEEYTTVKGVRQGTYKSYFTSGQLKEYATYVDGQEEGIVQQWFANGHPYLLYTVRDGLRQGTAVRWYSNGLVASLENFKNGLEDGRATYFYADGRVQCEIMFEGGEVVRLQHFD